MDEFSEPDFWWRWLRIVLIDIMLAGDNALVIALAVRSLPPKQQLWGRIWGTVGAIGLRLLFVTIVIWLLKIPLLQLVGGLALIWIAVKLVRHGEHGPGKVRQGTSLREAIGIIIVADIVMSLDNVIAIAAAAEGSFALVVFGLLLSLPLVVWGSGLLARLMNRFRWIIWAGGGVLGYVAMKMMLDDRWMANWVAWLPPAVHHTLPLLLGAIVTVLGWWFSRTAEITAGVAAETPRQV